MDSKIIELLRLKGMGNISSFLLQNYWTILVIIFLLAILLWMIYIVTITQAVDFYIIPVFALLGVVISIFILSIINISVQTPLSNLESTSIDKKINITEYHDDYILDTNNHKYKIGLMKNINTSSFYKRSLFKRQINGYNTQVKLIKYKGDNIIVNYTPQKRTIQ